MSLQANHDGHARPGEGAIRRLACGFLRQTDGATAVEFALVSPFLLTTILFLLSIGYMIIMNQCLDYATAKAARLIRTGQTQTANITTSAAFVTQELCPLLPSLFNCNNLVVYTQNYPSNVWVWWTYPYTIYTPMINSNNTGLVFPPLNQNNAFCVGNGSTYVYLQVLYPVNFFLSFLSSSTIATTYNGGKYYMIMSTAVFLNEPFTATAPC